MDYPNLVELCADIERGKPSLLCNSGIDPAAFRSDKDLTTAMLVEPNATVYDEPELLRYLDAKERVYLLEHGVRNLAGAEQEVATMLFLKGTHWSVAADKLYLSKATIFRIRSQALVKLARGVDIFMNRKVQMLFG